jgi:hypothetical protein
MTVRTARALVVVTRVALNHGVRVSWWSVTVILSQTRTGTMDKNPLKELWSPISDHEDLVFRYRPRMEWDVKNYPKSLPFHVGASVYEIGVLIDHLVDQGYGDYKFAEVNLFSGGFSTPVEAVRVETDSQIIIFDALSHTDCLASEEEELYERHT